MLKGERNGALTHRELEVLQMIVDGKSNKEIAMALESQCQHHRGSPREHHELAGNS